MNGSYGYIEVLFEAKGISDFFQRFITLETIMKYDNKVMTAYAEDNKNIALEIEKYNNEKTKLEDMAKSNEVKIAEYQAMSEEKALIVADIDKAIEEQEALVVAKEQEFNEILSAINNVSGSTGNNSISRGDNLDGQTIYSITGNINYPITSSYGWRTSPITGQQEFQAAIDIGAPHGSGVHSLMSGTVAYAGWMSGYGNVVVIKHGTMSSLYAHNSQLLVSVGQQVSGGQKIALVGSTGNSTGPHIHFEVTNNSGAKIDPTPYYIY